MTFVITSNHVDTKSIHKYQDNFILCMSSEKENNDTEKYLLQVFYQDGMNLEDYDEYESDDTFTYAFNPTQSILTAVDTMIDIISTEYANSVQEAKDNDDTPEEFIVVVACDYGWNHKVANYMHEQFRERKISIDPLNIYRHMMFPSKDRLGEYVKSTLETEFVYPDDPLQFGYALLKVVGGSRK